jgi:hypothetical protein
MPEFVCRLDQSACTPPATEAEVVDSLSHIVRLSVGDDTDRVRHCHCESKHFV